MKKMMLLSCVLTFSISFMSACGGSDDSPNVDLGVSGDTVVKDLTAAEMTAVCEGFQTAVNKVFTKETLCKFVGYFTGHSANEDQSTICKTATDACNSLSEIPDPSTLDLDLECELKPTSIVGCDATISEVEVCVQDMVDTIFDVFNSLSCDNIDNPPNLDDMDSSTACQALQTKCPGLMTEELE